MADKTRLEEALAQRYIKKGDLARRWCCDPQMVQRLVELGRLDAFRLSPDKKKSEVRISLESVQRFEQGVSMSAATVEQLLDRADSLQAEFDLVQAEIRLRMNAEHGGDEVQAAV